MDYTKIILLVLLTTALLMAAAGCVEPDGTPVCVVENQTDQAEEEQTKLSSQEEDTVYNKNLGIKNIGNVDLVFFSITQPA